MNTQHTTGPWQLDIPAETGKSCTVRAADHRTPIAEILKPGLTYNDAYRGPRYAHEYQANARLITAAPELLAALKESQRGDILSSARIICDRAGHPNLVKALQHLEDCQKTAIAKAEGRS